MSGSILLSFDIEEFDIPLEYDAHIPWNEQLEISRLGTERILNLLDDEEVVATFFVTVTFAEAYPDLIARMVASGHEIGSHGMAHSSFEEHDLEKSRLRLEEISGAKVTSFRMARLAEVNKKAISAAGYLCESSINPVWLPGRYNNRNLPLTPYYEESGFWQYPISALPWIRFPLFWLSFKNLPLRLYKSLALSALRRYDYFNIYLHPWEFNERSAEPQWNLPKYITRHAGVALQERLRLLIKKLKKGGSFTTYQAVGAARK